MVTPFWDATTLDPCLKLGLRVDRNTLVMSEAPGHGTGYFAGLATRRLAPVAAVPVSPCVQQDEPDSRILDFANFTGNF